MVIDIFHEQMFYFLLLFVQAMVHYNRLELLNHPVCKKYLAMKWWVCTILPQCKQNYFHTLRMLARIHKDDWLC